MAKSLDAAQDSRQPAQHSPWLLAGVAAVLVFGSALTKVTSYDTWVHLSLGRWMSEHGAIPRTNLLSFTEPDRPTRDHQWLFQALLYELWQTAGPAGTTLLKAALVAAAFGFVLATARTKGSEAFLACLVVVAAAEAARFRFTLRPQVAGFFLFAAYLWVLERWREGKPWGLLVLLPLQIAWANLHGSAIMGCGVVLAWAAAETTRSLIARWLSGVSPRPRGLCEVASLWAVGSALVALSLLNPNGSQLLTLPFTHAATQATSGLKELLLDRAAVRGSDLLGRHVFFTFLAAAGLLTLVLSVLRRDVTEVGLFILLLAAAVSSERFVGLFAVAAAPIVARNLTVVLAAPLGAVTAAIDRHYGAGVWLFFAAFVLCLAAGLGVENSRADLPVGLGIAPGRFPEAETAFVQANYPKGNLFNDFEFGGYIAWRTRRPVFLDSRGVLAYDPAFIKRYVELWTSPGPSLDWLERYAVAVALVGRGEVQQLFRADPRWQLVFRGMLCDVFVRRPERR